MRRAAPLAAAAALLLAAGCGGGGGGGGGGTTIRVGAEEVPVRVMTGAVEGLCTARRQAATDPAAAGATFFDRAHDPLHTIARALEGVDRAGAAALLEAKQRVEADLAPAAAGPKLADDLGRLVGVTRAGLGRLAVEAPSCAK